jgi:signal transduction histidine kinase
MNFSSRPPCHSAPPSPAAPVGTQPPAPDGRREVEALLNAGERERRQIAADLHGDILQVLGALRLKLDALASDLQAPEQSAAVADMEGAVELATKRLRALLFELWPSNLERDGLAQAISELLANLEREGLSTRLVVDLPSELPLELRGVIYRVIAEALANVRQHAGASSVEVELAELNGTVRGRIRDDGVGFDPSAAPFGHLGLWEMLHRARTAGGSIEIRSAPGQGADIQLSVPVAPRGQVDSEDAP